MSKYLNLNKTLLVSVSICALLANSSLQAMNDEEGVSGPTLVLKSDPLLELRNVDAPVSTPSFRNLFSQRLSNEETEANESVSSGASLEDNAGNTDDTISEEDIIKHRFSGRDSLQEHLDDLDRVVSAWNPIEVEEVPQSSGALVTPTEHGFIVDATFHQVRGEITELVRFGYQKAQEREDAATSPDGDVIAFPKKFTDRDWTEPKYFSGTRGVKFVDPFAGFVTRKKNILAVVIHGSASTADWITNGLGPLKDSQSLTHKGKVHAGFAHKHASYQKNMMAHLLATFGQMTAEERMNAKVIVTGHSQGGGLATLALADVVETLKKVYGDSYDNTKDHRVYGYLLAAARAGDTTFAQGIEACVGKDNIIRQNVKHDPVPNAAPGILINNALRPVIGESANLFSGNKSVGHLALQDSGETVCQGMNISAGLIAQRWKEGYLSQALSTLRGVSSPDTIIGTLHMATPDPIVGRRFTPSLVQDDLENRLSYGLGHQKTNAARGDSVSSRIYHAVGDFIAGSVTLGKTVISAIPSVIETLASTTSSLLTSAGSALSRLGSWFSRG